MKLPLWLNRHLTRRYLRRKGVEWTGELPEMDMLRPPQFAVYGKLKLGSGVKFFTHLGPTLIQVDRGATITIGDHTVVGSQVWMRACKEITIADKVLIALGVCIMDSNMHPISPTDKVECKPVKIATNTWLAVRAIILPGVHVGENAIVGAAGVVRTHVQPNAVMIGNPATEVGTIKDLPDGWYRIEY